MKKHLFFKIIRKIRKQRTYTDRFVALNNQEAYDYIYSEIEKAINARYGLMISKFGTIELNCINCYLQNKCNGKVENINNATSGIYELYIDDAIDNLCKNAGFFPNDTSLVEKYVDLTLSDMGKIDVLGSYLEGERFVESYMSPRCKRVNLNGFYAPYLWKNPWSMLLKGQRVLVIHPFAETINSQYYNNREKLFSNQDVLPEFRSLEIIPAVQSIAGEQTDFNSWFEALKHMENEIDKCEFDIAIIGCGAYGMNLASYVKGKGKIAIHLAGWTQMLFGIYGKRWIEDQPEFGKFVNEYWTRPNVSERPKNADSVEGGCYW